LIFAKPVFNTGFFVLGKGLVEITGASHLNGPQAA
jgi:hypothetical protein